MDNLYQLINQFWTLLQQGQLPEVGRWNYVLLVAASAGLMRPWAVFVAAALGNMTADALWYLLGYSGRLDAALRLGRFVGLRRTHIEHLTTAMQKHGLRILFFAKLTAGFMIPSLIAAGMVRLPWKRWLPVLLLGEFIWTGTLLTIGYFTTESIKLISREISFLVLGVSIVFLAVVIWQGRRILFKTQEFNEAIHARDENIPAK
jgi:membrane protein DedA with SNARE-associated domain